MSSVPAPPANAKVHRRRLIALYLAVFAAMGVFIPFFPLWLHGRGFGAGDVGDIVAAGIWVRVVAGPLWGRWADRRDAHRGTLIALAAIAVAALGVLHVAQGFWAVLVGTVLFSAAFSPMIPVSDGVVVLHARAAAQRGQTLDYGRVRLFGSLSFLVVCALVGEVVEQRSTGSVLPLLATALGCAGIAAWAIHRPSLLPVGGDGGVPDLGGTNAPWRRPDFLLLCFVVLLIQGSHGAYYTFAIRHWGVFGIGEGTAALLVAEGVVAEILLFAVAARLSLRPTTLLMIAGLAGVVRWTVLAQPPSTAIVASVQWLHALTFGLTHLAAVQWVARHVGSGATATAQTLLAAAGNGVGVALATMVSGTLVAADGGAAAFVAMAVVAGCGAVAALTLRLVSSRKAGGGAEPQA